MKLEISNRIVRKIHKYVEIKEYNLTKAMEHRRNSNRN
jgi:hypothetical protein